MDGVELFNLIIKSTGLPEDAISRWFEKKINQSGYRVESLSTEQVRTILNDVLIEIVSEN